MLRILILLFIAIPGFAQSPYQQAINNFVADPQLKNASVSISLVDTKDGQLIASHDPNRSLIPASTLKLVTTAAALHSLGKDYQFKTRLIADGAIDEAGVLQGNLIIKGFGDPTLGSHHFAMAEDRSVILQKWVQAVQAHGITAIRGKLVGDASWLEGTGEVASWPWEDIGNYYGSGAWGLNFHENLYFLHLQQKNALGARPAILRLEPEIPNLLLLNELSSAPAGSGDNAYIFGGSYGYTRFLRGTIPVGSGVFKVKGAVPDPPLFAAHELALALKQAGIEVGKGVSTAFEMQREGAWVEQEAEGFYIYYSPSIGDIVKEAHLKSVNIYCEALLKTMGKEIKKEGSTEAGLEVVAEFLREKGISTAGFFMVDGSGLSPRNGSSSFVMAQLLEKLSTDTYFKNTLAVGGKSGTLKYLFRGSGYEGRIIGKSGGMGRVRSYAGYVKNNAGRELAFSIIANNYSGEASAIRRKMERLMIKFCK